MKQFIEFDKPISTKNSEGDEVSIKLMHGQVDIVHGEARFAPNAHQLRNCIHATVNPQMQKNEPVQNPVDVLRLTAKEIDNDTELLAAISTVQSLVAERIKRKIETAINGEVVTDEN